MMRCVVCFLIILLASSCRLQKEFVAESESTLITVHQREVPVFTPKIDVNANGKIWIDPNGLPKLGELNVATNSDKPKNKQPKVSASIDKYGNLKVSVVIPEDTVSIAVQDTTKHTLKNSTRYVEVEKENPWWKKTLMFIGLFVVSIIIPILVYKLRLIKK